MNPEHDLQETTLDGPKTRRWVVEAAACAEMGKHRIARLGMDEALPPYRRVRMKPEGSFVFGLMPEMHLQLPSIPRRPSAKPPLPLPPP